MKSLSNGLLIATCLTGIAAAHDRDNDIARDIVETHDISGFDRIAVEGVYKLDVKVGPDFSVRTEARDNEADQLKVYRDGDTLILGRKDGREMRRGDHLGVLAVVTLPELGGLDVAGIATGQIGGIDASLFTTDIEGIANIALSGRCDRLSIDLEGLGETDARDLVCKHVDAAMSGMGKLVVHASDSVDAQTSGMGGITVYGDPAQRDVNSTLTSRVRFKT